MTGNRGAVVGMTNGDATLIVCGGGCCRGAVVVTGDAAVVGDIIDVTAGMEAEAGDMGGARAGSAAGAVGGMSYFWI